MMKKVELKREAEGYLSVKNKPSVDELKEYYSSKYYQDSNGAYEQEYSDDELTWKRSVEDITALAIRKSGKVNSFLDIGCGEGFLLEAMNSKNNRVFGVDFSQYGIKKQNPQMLENFVACDIYDFIENENLDHYDCISLMHVIEHVIDPKGLIETLKRKMKPGAMIVIRHPNDDSVLHQYAKSKGKFNEDFFVAYPDHLSYFNANTMESFLASLNITILSKFSAWPVDLAILNDDTNYAQFPERGKNVHKARVLTHNLLSSISNDKYLDLLMKFSDMGLGRDLTFICRV